MLQQFTLARECINFYMIFASKEWQISKNYQLVAIHDTISYLKVILYFLQRLPQIYLETKPQPKFSLFSVSFLNNNSTILVLANPNKSCIDTKRKKRNCTVQNTNSQMQHF